MLELIKRLVKDEKGQGLTEYALILGAIAIAVVGILFAIGGHIGDIFSGVEDELGGVTQHQ